MPYSDLPRFTVRSPADLIAAVPYLLGFHPADSLVVVALHGSRISFAARVDLPASVSAGDLGAATDGLAAVVARQRVDSVTIIGYGPAAHVTAVVDAASRAIARRDLRIIDLLRVTDGRWWSYLCHDPECCPAEGRPLDPSTSPVAAAAVFAGQVALPDRAALARQVAPVGGVDRVALRQATERAVQRLATLGSDARRSGSGTAAPGPVDRLVRAAGAAAVRAALDRHRSGVRLTDDEVAWLGLLVSHLPVRDDAWALIDSVGDQIDLWTDVVRRVEPALVPAPASLLAFAAWLDGHGALAAVALDRALDADPDYPLALLLDDALRRGVPPSALRDWPDLPAEPDEPGGAAGASRPARRGPGRQARSVARRPHDPEGRQRGRDPSRRGREQRP